MASFKALNIESDDESVDEVDDTKEVQIEEALKLYQNALKYHSQGSQSYGEAGAAYKALFESEIFRYPESLSELRRNELYGLASTDDIDTYEAAAVLPAATIASSESAPSTLPQILHLSYKNHGEYLLELTRRARDLATGEQESHNSENLQRVRSALQYFVEALDKDGKDRDLWRRTSSVASAVGSQRLARYCLETVLDQQSDTSSGIPMPASILDSLAVSDYMKITDSVGDDHVSFKQPKLHPQASKMLAALAEPVEAPSAAMQESRSLADVQSQPFVRTTLGPLENNWVEVGEALLRQFLFERDAFGHQTPSHGIAINIKVPQPTQVEEVVPNTLAPVPHTPTLPIRQAVDNSAKAAIDREPSQSVTVAGTDDDEQKQPPLATVDEPTNGEGVKDASDAKEATSRKRSHSSTGLPEGTDGTRVRSKRIRARDTATDGPPVNEDAAIDPVKQYEEQLQPYAQADDILFETMRRLYKKANIKHVPSAQVLREATYFDSATVTSPHPSLTGGFDLAIVDFQYALRAKNGDLARLLLASGDLIDELGSNSPQAGLSAILGHAKRSSAKLSQKPRLSGNDGVAAFCQEINDHWYHVQEAAWQWVQCFLRPGCFPADDSNTFDNNSSYTIHQWSDAHKALLVRMIVNLDDFIYSSVLQEVEGSGFVGLSSKSDPSDASNSQLSSITEMIQNLFELHLDVYSLIKHPGSGVDQNTQILQGERLNRWSELAHCVLEQFVTNQEESKELQPLVLRHLWATTFHLSVSDNVAQDFVITCLEDVKSAVERSEIPIVELQNNAIMPEISLAAMEREISKLTTKDFFIRIFDPSQSDPVMVIESLEPVLEASNADGRSQIQSTGPSDNEEVAMQIGADRNDDSGAADGVQSSLARVSPVYDELFKFLEHGSLTVKLSLWQRLRAAYYTIDYPSKILSCYLRSIETMARELSSVTYRESSQEQRLFIFMKALKMLDELCQRCIATIEENKDAFECVDADHIQSSLGALISFAGLLQTFNIYHDALKSGQILTPLGESTSANIVPMLANKLQDSQIRLWKLQYLVFLECLQQEGESDSLATEDKFDFLRTVHASIGIRCFCKGANRIFLRLMKKEMLQMTSLEDGDSELAQVLYDQYGLDLFPNSLAKYEHGCPPETLDRKTALSLLDFVLIQASRVNTKDLPKTELKGAIEKIHGSLPKIKSTEGMNRNRSIYRNKLKAPIQPLELYNSLDGVGGLPFVHVTPQEAPAASKGWYFLMGQLALSRFRTQRRVGPVPTEDIMLAIAFFGQDLEYRSDKWETWFRLAQAYDVQVEEDVMWSAEGLNNNSSDIVQHQRSAIHCYTLAVALAVNSADFSYETSSKMADMYYEFGNRIYSSSREPFAMKVFAVDDFERTYSGEQLYKRAPFMPLRPYAAWKFAAALFKRAIIGKPESWMNYYMLGKCLWKMHSADPENPKSPTVENMLEAFIKAIKALPERKDRQYPVLEPHYKIVSVVHKLVERSELSMTEAVEAMSATSYAQGVSAPLDDDEWSNYVLLILKNMRSADKSNWHHRMVARAAVIIANGPDEESAVNGAKQELMQQILTKTMTVQVWKPENERPGRHFVYTFRYSSFFIKLLVLSDDRANLEALARRLRRKPNDFLDHTKLWQELCLAYLQLLRRAGNVPEGYEDIVFKSITSEDFSKRAPLVEAWSRSPSNTSSLVDVLRETIELKKLNNSLMKSTLIDDLIGDTYALMYGTVGTELEANAEAQQPPNGTQEGSSTATATAPATGGRESGVMSLSNMMNVDGIADVSSNAPTPTPTNNGDSTAPKPRTRGVGRRELRQAAEAAVLKPAGAPVPIKPQPIQTAESAKPQVLMEIRNEGRSGIDESAPGSVHDSADDESELSELEEADDEILVRPMFPGLIKADSDKDKEKPAEKEEENKGHEEGSGEKDD
ncbi:MAG: Histone transcription regulator 3 [Bogoriella megaspora]|nr:MAG: Histone transcription regulator 3 [Bogoriella megaspora]